MPAEPTRAVYVRMPDKLAQKLDSAAARFGVSKRDLLATLVSDYLDIEGEDLVIRPHGARTAGAGKGPSEGPGKGRPEGPGRGVPGGPPWARRSPWDRKDGFGRTASADGTESAGDTAGAEGTTAAGVAADAPATPNQGVATDGGGEVLTLEEAATLLRVAVDDVRALVESGDLPARRIGEQWRLNRTGVLSWLRGDSPEGATPAQA